MKTRTMAALLVGGLALALVGVPAVTASAAEGDEIDAVLIYSGNSVVSAETGETVAVDVVMTVDCTGTPCLLSGRVTSEGVTVDFTGPPIPVIDGRAVGQAPAVGDPCGESYITGGALDAVVTETAVTGTFASPGTDEIACSDGAVIYIASTVTITTALVSGDACVLTGTCATASPTPTAEAAAPISDTRPTTVSTPGVLSTLPTIAEAATPGNIAWAAVVTVILALLVALPSHLLTEATGAGAARLSSWWSRVRGRADRVAATPRAAGWPAAAAGLVVAALISSFVDPEFGFSLLGLRIFGSVLVSLVLDVAIGWIVVILVMRRLRPDAPATVRLQPGTLIVVLAAVLFTRATGFEPGIIFGLVAGVVFGVTLAIAERARVILLGLGWSFAIAILGWLAYSALAPVVEAAPTAGGVFALEALSALAVGGIAALPIALVPIAGLAGHEVFRWNRWAWAGAYAAGLFAFTAVLMPVPFSWETVGVSLPVWIGAYLAYAIVAVGLWLWLTRPWAGRTSDATAD